MSANSKHGLRFAGRVKTERRDQASLHSLTRRRRLCNPRCISTVLLDIADSVYGLSITDQVTLMSPVTDPTATFSDPLEAAIRLLTGRLGPNHTPSDLEITGNTTLEHLRAVVPDFKAASTAAPPRARGSAYCGIRVC